jgi:imidazolonepropionase-like amidohydrolase
LDPSLLKAIVKMAYAAGLRVSTHIEDAADFHNALMADVDEINHMPGFRSGSDVEKHAITEFEISEADARLAAKQQTFVVTTLSAGALQLEANQRTEQDQQNARNLRLLLQHHVHLALGSDAYHSDTLPEALYINSLHVMDSATLLNIWSTFTAETIFPRRKIGFLKEGYEASFLVLGANPIENFAAVEQITLSVKQGHVFDPAKLSNDAANRAQ